jgi:hypothetical protein
MAWTYETRMARVVTRLVDNDRLDADCVALYKRARFFNKYAFRIGIGLSLSQWVNFDEIVRDLHAVFDPLGAHIVAVRTTMDVYVYGNDPAILTWLAKRPSFRLTDLFQTDPKFWHKKLPKAKKQTVFYGEYHYRIRMRDQWWGLDAKNVEQLDALEMDHKLLMKSMHHTKNVQGLSQYGRYTGTFIYVRKLNEVLVLKLVFGDQVGEVIERP